MDSTKINLLEKQQTPPPNSQNKNNQKPFIFFLIIILSLLLLGILTLTIAIAIAMRNSSYINYFTSSFRNSGSSRTVCSFAPHRKLCRHALSSAISAAKSKNSGTDDDDGYISPENIIFLSFQLGVTQLSRLASLPTTLLSKSNTTVAETAALKDCHVLLNKEVSRLNESVASAMNMYWFRNEQVNDYVERLNAIGTHQQACLDKLEGSTVIDEVKASVQKTRKYMSNTVAILSSIDSILAEIYFSDYDYNSFSYYGYLFGGLCYEYMILCFSQYAFIILLFVILLKQY